MDRYELIRTNNEPIDQRVKHIYYFCTNCAKNINRTQIPPTITFG